MVCSHMGRNWSEDSVSVGNVPWNLAGIWIANAKDILFLAIMGYEYIIGDHKLCQPKTCASASDTNDMYFMWWHTYVFHVPFCLLSFRYWNHLKWSSRANSVYHNVCGQSSQTSCCSGNMPLSSLFLAQGNFPLGKNGALALMVPPAPSDASGFSRVVSPPSSCFPFSLSFGWINFPHNFQSSFLMQKN